MEITAAEQVILDRFLDKTRMAGGPRTGFILRREAILFIRDQHPDLNLETGLAGLVEKGLLKVNEAGDFYFLSASGAERLDESPGG